MMKSYGKGKEGGCAVRWRIVKSNTSISINGKELNTESKHTHIYTYTHTHTYSHTNTHS